MVIFIGKRKDILTNISRGNPTSGKYRRGAVCYSETCGC